MELDQTKDNAPHTNSEDIPQENNAAGTSATADGISTIAKQSCLTPAQPQHDQAPPEIDHVSIQVEQAPSQGGYGLSQIYVTQPPAGNATPQVHYSPPNVSQGPPPPYTPDNQPIGKQPTGFMYANAQALSMAKNPELVVYPGIVSSSAAAVHVTTPRPSDETTCETVLGGYVIPAFFAIFCCAWPCAIPSLVFAVYSNFLKAEGKTQDAEKKADCARNWLIASVITGIIGIIIIVTVYSTGGAAEDNYD